MNIFSETKNIYKILSSHPLTQRQKARAFCRFLQFQIKQRFRPSSSDWIGGLKLNVTPGSGLTGNIYCGLFEFSEMGFLLHYLKPEDHFVDVGANAGVFTLLSSGICKAISTAFEPIPATFQKLQRHIEMNRLQDEVTCIQKGVSNKPGTLRFTNLSKDCLNHIISKSDESPDSTETIPVTITTLDYELAENSSPVLLKMDIEGHELFALQGAKELLKKTELNAIILECTSASEKYGVSRASVFEFMKENNFHPFSYNPFTRNLTAQSVAEDADNVIFIRDLQQAENRVKSAELITVFNQTF